MFFLEKFDVFSSRDNFYHHIKIFSPHIKVFFCYIEIFFCHIEIFSCYIEIFFHLSSHWKRYAPTHKTYTVSQPGRVETLNNIILTLYTPSTISTIWIQFRPVTLCPMCVTSGGASGSREEMLSSFCIGGRAYFLWAVFLNWSSFKHIYGQHWDKNA